jgi:5-(carboxyamino)imidazole ribonucleotide mutase
VLREFGVACEVEVSSAHRSPARTVEYAGSAAGRGIRVLVVGAGAAAHLAGVVAAHTILPVIGVPIPSSALLGMDSLLSTAQMPGGIPVATMALGKAGAKNAALLALQILALEDEPLRARLQEYRDRLAAGVAERSEKLKERIRKDGA